MVGGFHALGATGNASFVRSHGGVPRQRFGPDAGSGTALTDEAHAAALELEEKAALLATDPTAMAAYVLEAHESAESFGRWLRGHYKKLGIQMPSITVSYSGLSVQAEAAVGSDGVPTLVTWITPRSCCAGGSGSSNGGSRTILPLQNLDGTLLPGRLTLLLGKPGSGKSVLLKALAGQLPASRSLQVRGHVRYNGKPIDSFDVKRTACYVDQYDNHLPLLTVRETLLFARKCLWAAGAKDSGEEELRMVIQQEAAEQDAGGRAVLERHRSRLVSMLSSDDLFVEVALRLLGLEGVGDTIVGDAMIRGISGGQRRRLTAGELLVGGRSFLSFDEISTGLDSATTHSITQYLGYWAHSLDGTFLVSLLQPSQEVFGLFDDVILLAEGRVLYHGPVEEAVAHFEAMGFAPPPRMEAPAFLLEVTMEQRALATPAFLEAVKPTQAQEGQLVSMDALSESFWKGSAQGKRMADLQGAPPVYDGPRMLAVAGDASPWTTFFRLCLGRQTTLLWRDTELLQGRIFQVALVAIIVGTLFLRLHVEAASAIKFLGASFLAVALLVFLSMPLTGVVFNHKPVFLKHRGLGFFPSSAYCLSLATLEAPASCSAAVLFSVLVYWLVGFAPDAGRFFMFTAQLAVAGLDFGALFVLLAAMTPTLQVAGGLSGVIMLLLILLSGFSLVRNLVPGWWIWLYWANPMAWTFRAVVTNEFTAGRWDVPLSNTTLDGPSVGESVLSNFGMWRDYTWVWSALLYNIGIYGLLVAISCFAFGASKAPAKQATVAAEAEGGNGARTLEAVEAQPASAGSGGATIDIAFSPITLAFKNISYFVAKPSWSKAPESAEHPGMVQLLHSLTGCVRPGELACLMGSSGAGKSTLLDVLAGRKTQGLIEGEIFLNGRPKEDGLWRRLSAYVEQTDIHTAKATVLESLIFSARLRLPGSVTDADVSSYVDKVLDLVELRPLAHAMVGEPGGGGVGLSLEQRKRLSIAVELVASPAVLFLDEPTSGLDGSAARVVMKCMRGVANAQRAVLCTIHQPSAAIFLSFDVLVLLQTGGHLMYFGPVGHEAEDLIAYFSSAGGVRGIKPGENPANWMLSVGGSSAAGDSTGPDFVEIYQAGGYAKRSEATVKAAVEAGLAGPEPTPPGGAAAAGTEYAAPRMRQLKMLMWRQALRYWRLPEYNAIRLLVTLVFALVLGSLYWDKGQVAPGSDTTHVTAVLNVLFMSLSNLGAINLAGVVVVAAQERAVLYRERASGMYAASAYVHASALVELPYLAAQVLIFCPVAYFMIGFTAAAGSFFFFMLVFYLSLLFYTSFGQAVLYVMPNVQAAQALSATLLGLFDIFNGFFVARNQMPVYWRWLWYADPSSWMAYSLASNQLGGSTVPVTDAAGNATTVGAFIESTYGYKAGWEWWCVLILLGFIFGLRAASMLAVRYLNFQKR